MGLHPKPLSLDGWQAYATDACMETKQDVLGRLKLYLYVKTCYVLQPIRRNISWICK